MKAWKLGLAATVLGAALAATLLAQAAPGDVLVMAITEPFHLTNPQKSLAADALHEVFPSANAATVRHYSCQRTPNGVRCRGSYERTLSRDDFIAAAVDGLSGEVVEFAGGNVTFHQQAVPTYATSTTAIAAFASSACGKPLNKLRQYSCDKGGADIVCRCGYVDTVDPDTYVALAQAGLIERTIDIVE